MFHKCHLKVQHVYNVLMALHVIKEENKQEHGKEFKTSGRLPQA